VRRKGEGGGGGIVARCGSFIQWTILCGQRPGPPSYQVSLRYSIIINNYLLSTIVSIN
jgi:hypothetical protein